MRRHLRFAWLVLCCSWCNIALAQTISGEVYDKSTNTPIPGATVIASSSRNGTTTDMEGKFTLTLNGDHHLEISHAGFRAIQVPVTAAANYRIELETSEMDQVVVVGYGTQKKANLTGAVATVDVNATLGSRPISDLSRGLQGAVAGLTITTPSGDLGTNPTIRLRGLTGSLNAPGGAKPLILVDNVELPDLRMINPGDIENISVLKDAASTSIYGSRGAWGVILITTKSGKRGGNRSNISYNNNFSISKPTTTPIIADAAKGAEMAFLAQRRTNPNLTVFGVVGMYFDEIAIQKMRDWQQQYGNQDLGPEMVEGRDFEIRSGRLFFYRPWDAGEMYMRDWTPQQTHNLTFSGSSGKTSYNLNIGYLNQEGVLKVNPDKFDRYNINLGVTSAVTDWLDARTKIILSKGLKTRPYYFSSDTYDPWYYLYRWPKTYPYGTLNGKPFRSAVTEVEQAKMNEYESTLARAAVGGTFKILKGLTADVDYTYAETNDHDHQTGGVVSAYNFWAGGGTLVYEPYTSATYDRAIYYSYWDKRSTLKAYLTYIKKISDHDIKLMAGSDIESLKFWSQTSERRGLLDPNFGEPGLATGDQFVRGSRGHWATLGYFGRVNYAFKGKYLLELNGRFDGSSSFPKNDQWAFFPSMSAGYVISQEPFMAGISRWVPYLKLRGSWGSVGNQGVGNNPFLSVLSSQSSNWLVNNVNMLTMSTPGLVSPTLTWETVTTLDFGVDARFFDNSFGVSFDWYKRTTSDMLSSGVTVPSTLGTGAPRRNYGEMETTGWELTLDWNHRFDNGINFGVTGVLSDFREKITKFANTTKLLSSNFEGKVLGDIWGYETDRFFTKDDFLQDANGDLIIQNGKYVMQPKTPTQERWESGWFFYGPGDIKYRDLNGDGKVDFGANSLDDHGDLRVIGNSTPRYQYGVRLNADWKGFDVAVYVQGVGKRQLWSSGPIFIPGFRVGEAWYEHQLDYWTPENPNAFYPRPTDHAQSNNTRNFLPQTKYLLNMAYTRLKNVTIGYTLPVKISSRIRLQNARIYVSGENLAEIDHLDLPIDPEVDYTTAGLNDANTFGRVYPYRRTYSLGLQVTF
jgi:TonB-linked outer membrane protein, SusC/RagA family